MHYIFSLTAKLIYPLLKLYWFIFRPKTYGVKVIIQCEAPPMDIGGILAEPSIARRFGEAKEGGNETLLVKHSYGSKLWTFPGGAIKKGETPEKAGLREIKEELGIETEQLTNHGSFLYTGEYKRDTIWVLSTKVDQRPVVNSNFEIKKHKWFNAEQLLTLRSPVAKKCLEKKDKQA